MIPLAGSEGWDRNLEEDTPMPEPRFHECPKCGWRLGDGDRVTGNCARCSMLRRRWL